MSFRRSISVFLGLPVLGLPVAALAVTPLFEAAVPLPGTTVGSAVVVADFDSDSLDDIMVITLGNTPDVLYINQGGLVFTRQDMPAAADGLGAAVADLDADGDLDVFVGTASTYDFYYRNDGNFSFVVRQLNQLGISTTLATGVEIADIDEDGRPDVAVSTSGNTRDVWYRNNGATTGVVSFTQNLLPVPAGLSVGTPGSDVGIGDMDDNGNLDIVVSCSSGKQVVYQAGASPGTFTGFSTSGTLAGTGCAVGKLVSSSNKAQAFLVAGNSAIRDSWVRHQGGANPYLLSSISGYDTTGLTRSSVGLYDLDKDGDLDAFMTRANAADVVALNNGTGSFSLDSFTGSTGNSQDVAFGDLDGDGDWEAVVATSGPGGTADLIYINRYHDGPVLVDTDFDGFTDDVDLDDDNDGVLDGTDPSSLNPLVCGDTDGDGCDDCSVGTDGFGPLSDKNTANDGLDTDGDGLCNTGDADDDNDGLSDTYEAANGLNPLVNDSSSDADNDGLAAILESQSGNNPNNPDTDSDGLPDGWEYHNFLVNQVRVIPQDSVWKYRDDGVSLGTSYHDFNHNDSTWKSGSAELGYGDGGERTLVNFGPNPSAKNITTYFRRKFNVQQKHAVQSATLHYVRDDGVCFTMNNTEVARSNLPAGTLGHTTLALSAIEGAAENTYLAQAIEPYQLLSGDNVLAVEIHQHTGNSPDISFNAYLSVTYPSRQADPSMDNDGDGVSNLDEFICGTPPQDANVGGTRLWQGVSVTGAPQFLFQTYTSSGLPGYAGKTRHYTVQFRDNLTVGTWSDLPGGNLIADGNPWAIQISGNARFYRVSTTLD